MSSRIADLNNRIVDVGVATQAATGTVNKFPAYLGKSMDDPTINVPIALSEYPSAQLSYFFTMDTSSPTLPQTRAFGSALNPDGYAQFGLPVWIAKHLESGLFIIVGRRDDDAGFYTEAGDLAQTGQAHGANHYIFGTGAGGIADPAFISTRQIKDWGVIPTSPPSMQITVCADAGQVRTTTYAEHSVLTTFTSADLSYLKPATPGEARWITIYANPFGLTGIEVGDTFVASTSVSADATTAKLSVLPFFCSPLAWVYLYNGQTTIDWEHIRRWAMVGPSGRYKINPNTQDFSDLITTPNPFGIEYNLVLAGPIVNTGYFKNTGIIKVV